MGYVWLAIWYTFTVFEIVYVKKVVDSVEMTTWSRTYYQVIHLAPLTGARLLHGGKEAMQTMKSAGYLVCGSSQETQLCLSASAPSQQPT